MNAPVKPVAHDDLGSEMAQLAADLLATIGDAPDSGAARLALRRFVLSGDYGTGAGLLALDLAAAWLAETTADWLAEATRLKNLSDDLATRTKALRTRARAQQQGRST